MDRIYGGEVEVAVAVEEKKEGTGVTQTAGTTPATATEKAPGKAGDTRSGK